MKNKQLLIKKSPPKLLVLDTEPPEEGKRSSKLFRKCRKVVKTLHISTTPRFVDQVHIQTQVKQWMGKMSDRKCIEQSQKTVSSKNNTLDLSSDRMIKLYNFMRQDEKIINGPVTQPQKPTVFKQASIKLNLKEVQKMRSGFEACKVVLSPKEFHVDLSHRPGTTLGSRPVQSRPERPINSRKNLMGSSFHHKKRCLTERKELFTLTGLQKYLEHSPTTPLSSSKEQYWQYTSRTKVKKIWETIGVHDWSNWN